MATAWIAWDRSHDSCLRRGVRINTYRNHLQGWVLLIYFLFFYISLVPRVSGNQFSGLPPGSGAAYPNKGARLSKPLTIGTVSP